MITRIFPCRPRILDDLRGDGPGNHPRSGAAFPKTPVIMIWRSPKGVDHELQVMIDAMLGNL